MTEKQNFTFSPVPNSVTDKDSRGQERKIQHRQGERGRKQYLLYMECFCSARKFWFRSHSSTTRLTQANSHTWDALLLVDQGVKKSNQKLI